MTRAFDEIVSFVAAGASREQVLQFQASDETKQRAEYLLHKEKTEGLLLKKKAN